MFSKRTALLYVCLALVGLRILSARPAWAQSQAAVITDVTGDGARDSQARAGMQKWLARYGYKAMPDDVIRHWAEQSGALVSGALTTDPSRLEALRTASGARILVRAFSAGTTGAERRVRMLVLDGQGLREIERSFPDAEVNARLPAMVDQALKQPAVPVQAAPPSAPTPPPAPPPPAPPGPASAAPGALDRVTLTDGTILDGRVLDHRPGAFVTIRLANGMSETVAWASVQRVMLAPRPGGASPGGAPQASLPPAGTAPAPVTTERTGADVDVGRSAIHLSQASGCPPGAPPEQCRERTDLQANRQGVQMTHEVNCAPGSQDERCREQLAAGIGEKGAGLSYHSERVERVTEPKSGSLNFALGAQLVLGFSTSDESDMSMIGPGISLGLTAIGGSQFPGTGGGSFNGVFFEPTAELQLMSATMGETKFQTNGLKANGSLGYQYIHFGTQDPVSLKQGGFGFRIGGSVGYQVMKGEFDMETQVPTFDEFGNITGYQTQTTTSEFENNSVSYGPTIGFSAVTYNPGTAKMSSIDFNAFVLPTGDFLFVMMGLSGRF